jgi:hypothetical protein
LPHKIHEAAAHGLPVVATPLLASQWTGVIVKLAIGGDAESFAARCVEYYSDPEEVDVLANCSARSRRTGLLAGSVREKRTGRFPKARLS